MFIEPLVCEWASSLMLPSCLCPRRVAERWALCGHLWFVPGRDGGCYWIQKSGDRSRNSSVPS
jgi:hypothetical protein